MLAFWQHSKSCLVYLALQSFLIPLGWLKIPLSVSAKHQTHSNARAHTSAHIADACAFLYLVVQSFLITLGWLKIPLSVSAKHAAASGLMDDVVILVALGVFRACLSQVG